MASALCRLACDRSPEARFSTVPSPAMRLRCARDEGGLDLETAQIGRASLLVIDELGFLPLDADGACPVSQTFADACERQSVMTTTSMEFFRWGSVFGDDRMAAAVVDRIVHHGMLAQFKGESYRVRHALMWGRVLKNGAQIPCASCSKVIVHSAQNYLTKHVPRPVQGRVDQAPAELPRVVLLGAPGRWLGRRWGRGPTGRAGWALAPSVSVPSGARDVVGGLKKPSAKSRAHGHCAVVVALCETGCCGC